LTDGVDQFLSSPSNGAYSS